MARALTHRQIYEKVIDEPFLGLGMKGPPLWMYVVARAESDVRFRIARFHRLLLLFSTA